MGHPNYVFSNDFNNNCTIIKWGESGYYRTDYPEGSYTDEVIDMMNADRGITKAERQAMEICSMVAQGKPDLNWEEHFELCMNMSK